MKMKDKICSRCIYRAGKEMSRYTGNCDYILIKHESRGCPADEHCARFEEGPRIKRREDIALCL